MRVFLASLLFTFAGAACQPVQPDRDGTDPPPAAADTTRAADGPDAQPVGLRTDRDQYRPGDPVGLTFVNRAEATYSFNPCVRRVEREAGGAWVAVDEPERVCTMEAWLIEPGATRTADTELPATLDEGRYRLVVVLAREGPAPAAEPAEAVSEAFTVAP